MVQNAYSAFCHFIACSAFSAFSQCSALVLITRTVHSARLADIARVVQNAFRAVSNSSAHRAISVYTAHLAIAMRTISGSSPHSAFSVYTAHLAITMRMMYFACLARAARIVRTACSAFCYYYRVWNI